MAKIVGVCTKIFSLKVSWILALFKVVTVAFFGVNKHGMNLNPPTKRPQVTTPSLME